MRWRIFYLTLVLLVNFYSLMMGADQNDLQTPKRLLELATNYNKAGKNDSAIIVSNSILEYCMQYQDTSTEAEAFLLLGRIYTELGQLDSSLACFSKADTLFLHLNDSINRGIAIAQIAYLYRRNQQDDKAMLFYLKALDVFPDSSRGPWYAFINDHLGHIYLEQGNYHEALLYFQNAIQVSTQLNNLINVGSEYNAIGLIYRKTNEKEKEKKAYLDAIEILSKLDESVYLGEAYSNLSEIYIEEGRVDEGFEMLEKSRQIFQNINYPLGICAYYAVLAYYYDRKNPPNYRKVLELSKQRASLAMETKNYQQYVDATYFSGNAYLKLNQLDSARAILENGKQQAEHFGYLLELNKILGALSEVYKRLNYPSKALDLLELHIKLNDSLASAEKIKEFTSLDLTYQFRQLMYKDSVEQAESKRNLAYQYEKEIKIQQLRQLILAGVLIVIIGLVFLFVWFYKKQKSQNLILDEKNRIINKALDEKELLLKEIHHRVKNNFQTISSLLQLQSKGVVDEMAIQNIEEGQSRIKAMALIHQKLYQENDLSAIAMQDYTEQLVRQIAVSYKLYDIDIRINAHDISLDIDTAIPLGLILNELITNSCKYAFHGNNKGKLEITLLQSSTGYYELIHKDSGPGLPEGIDPNKLNSMGLRLINRLAQQLQGKVEYSYQNGAQFKVTILNRKQREEM